MLALTFLQKSKEKWMMARRCERVSAVFGQSAPWTMAAMTSSSCQSLKPLEVQTVGSLEDGVSYVRADFSCDGFDGAFFGSDHHLVGEVARSASSGTSEWLSMAGVKMVPLMLTAEAAAAVPHASLSMVVAVATDVDVMRAMVLVATQSLTMPFPGLPGLYVLRRVCRIPVMKVVASSRVYWPPALVRSASFAMLARTCSRVVACAMKQASAMVKKETR